MKTELKEAHFLSMKEGMKSHPMREEIREIENQNLMVKPSKVDISEIQDFIMQSS